MGASTPKKGQNNAFPYGFSRGLFTFGYANANSSSLSSSSGSLGWL
jgi:hypothetical protein